MSLKLKHGMLFLVIALCTLIGIASAAGGGTGGVSESALASFVETPSSSALVDDGVDNDDEIDDEVDNDDEIDDEVDNEGEVDDEVAIVESADYSIEGQLLDAAERLSENWSTAEMKEVMTSVYTNVDGVVMVYVINQRGVVDAVYPDKYKDAVGDFVGRSPVGGMLMKAREFTQTDEYTSAREKITGYDVVQPVFSSDDEYLGAIIAKFES